VDDRIVRGTIDCLIEMPDGELAVLEFKTGRRRTEHEAQTAVYAQAAASLFPGRRVLTQLLYAADAGIS
jgi:RecB family exonuclease